MLKEMLRELFAPQWGKLTDISERNTGRFRWGKPSGNLQQSPEPLVDFRIDLFYGTDDIVGAKDRSSDNNVVRFAPHGLLD